VVNDDNKCLPVASRFNYPQGTTAWPQQITDLQRIMVVSATKTLQQVCHK